MKKNLFFAFFSLLTCQVFSQSNTVSIIPEPVSVKLSNGVFTLPKNVIIEAGSQPQLQQTIAFLRQRLSAATGSTITVTNPATSPTVSLILNRTTDAAIGEEGYRLSVTPKKITISANEPAGIFYGVQSLIQLFPPAIESSTPVANTKWEAPTVEIMDYPRFGWRGFAVSMLR